MAFGIGIAAISVGVWLNNGIPWDAKCSYTYFKDGSLRWQTCQDAQGNYHGRNISYDYNRNYSITHYEHGSYEGETLYFRKGVKTYEANYKGGQLEGWEYRYYDNGTMSSKIFYKHGKPMDATKWYDNGEKSTMTKFAEDGSKTHYSWSKKPHALDLYYKTTPTGAYVEFKRFYPNGVTKLYEHYENEALTLREKFYDTGVISLKEYHKGSKREGPRILFHPNGVPEEYGTYRNDKLQGTYRYFSEDEVLVAKDEYIDGVRVQ